MMTETRIGAQMPSPAAFPQAGTASDKLNFLLHYAVFAPFVDNISPCVFVLKDDSVLLCIDHTRFLPLHDSDDRERIIGCGAALLYLRAALSHFTYHPDIRLLPNGESDDVLASVRLGDSQPPTDSEEMLFAQISRQHPNPQPFVRRPIPYPILAQLRAAAEAEGAWLVFADTIAARMRLAKIVAEGIRRLQVPALTRPKQPQWSDAAFKQSAALIPPRSPTLREEGTAHMPGASVYNIANQAPILAVLGTLNDTRHDWLEAGQALAHMLLRAGSYGLSTSFLNEPLAVRELRHYVDSEWAPIGRTQLILRVGYESTPGSVPTQRYISKVLR